MCSKYTVIALLFAYVLCLQGCSTVKHAAQGASVGAKEDWQALKKMDGWIKDNMW